MFNNLIESSSHAREFKRRGSFVLFTTATYVLLFIIAGVASIYAYDARLDDQNLEFVTMLNPVDLPPAPASVSHTPPSRDSVNRPNVAVREVAIATVNHPEIVPETTSAVPSKNPPVPEGAPYVIGDHNSDPVGPVGNGHPGIDGTGPGNGVGPAVVEIVTPPPPQPPVVKPVPKVVSKGPITGFAILLPKPLYPQVAKQAGAHGAVNVQVLVDETGKVISAKAVSGHPLLLVAAQQAALGARFSPTRLGEQAVKVSGVITYNFVLQ
ncbi:MAG: energy transducer TonB [Acidobacteriota bacterium]